MLQVPVPRAARLVTGALSAVVLASAMVGVVLAVVLPPKVGWAMVGFEAALVLTGVIGLLFARGRFPDAPALTLACLAGAVFVASFLAYFGVQKKLGSFSLTPWLAGRSLIALVLGMTAVAVALGKSPEGRRLLVKGVIWAALPVVSAALYVFRSRLPISVPAGGAMETLRTVGLAALGAASFIGLCGAVHCTVRAFEVALPPEEAP